VYLGNVRNKGIWADFTPIRTVISVNPMVAHHNLTLSKLIPFIQRLRSDCNSLLFSRQVPGAFGSPLALSVVSASSETKIK
jgi:hypothetical protein